MKENWLALFIAIMANKKSGQALRMMGVKLNKEKKHTNLSNIDFEKIIEFKKNHTWVEVGENFGFDSQCISAQVSIYKRKRDTKTPTKVDLVSCTNDLKNKSLTL